MAATIQWRGNWEEAAAEAKNANLPLLLELFLEGCPHCQRLDRETQGDAAVAAALYERFIPVRLEGRSHMDLVQKLGVRGEPATLIFSPEGKELRRFSGFLPPPGISPGNTRSPVKRTSPPSHFLFPGLFLVC